MLSPSKWVACPRFRETFNEPQLAEFQHRKVFALLLLQARLLAPRLVLEPEQRLVQIVARNHHRICHRVPRSFRIGTFFLKWVLFHRLDRTDLLLVVPYYTQGKPWFPWSEMSVLQWGRTASSSELLFCIGICIQDFGNLHVDQKHKIHKIPARLYLFLFLIFWQVLQYFLPVSFLTIALLPVNSCPLLQWVQGLGPSHLPFATQSLELSDRVPMNKCFGLKHDGLSHLWQTTNNFEFRSYLKKQWAEILWTNCVFPR